MGKLEVTSKTRRQALLMMMLAEIAIMLLAIFLAHKMSDTRPFAIAAILLIIVPVIYWRAVGWLR